MQRFRSKVDAWLVIVSLLPVVVVTVALVFAYVKQRQHPLGVLAVLVIVVFVALLSVWSFTKTDYTIDGNELLIRSAGLRWRIPIASIDTIRPTRSMVSAPALSLDRLEIRYAQRRILVSPADKHRFVDALRVVNPAIRATL